jgi:hypothetical protein
MSDTKPDIPTMVKKEELTSTANKLYEIYDQARAMFRAMQSKASEEEAKSDVKSIEDIASDSKNDN